MTNQEFDLVVVGAGPGGYVAAIRAAQLGMRTALVEKAELGGICLNWGCIPTKALLRSADVLRLIRNSDDFGISVSDIAIELPAIVKRSRSVASELQRGVAHLLKKNGIAVFNGHASLLGRQSLQVKTAKGALDLKAKHIILATGARARALPDFPVDGDSVWSYREALTPNALPRRLLVIGAGAIGVEFASFYHALGAEVHLLEMGPRVLPAEDAEISAHMADALRKQGIKLHLGSRVEGAQQLNNKRWAMQIQGPESAALEVDVVLVAAGIVGNIEALGLEKTAVKVENSHILTNEFSATHEPGVYAIGDVAGAPWLAHKASHEAVICVEKIAGLDPAPLNVHQIPAGTYSHPQVASVGLSEAWARENNRAIRVGKFPFKANGKAMALGDTDGFVKVILDEKSGELLGAHLVGEDVTELVQGFVVAMGLETTEEDLMRIVFAHPTRSEAMHEAVLAAYDKALHI